MEFGLQRKEEKVIKLKKRISFKRKSGRKVSFLRKPRKRLKNPRLTVGKKVYRRKTLRNPYGEFAGSKRVRK